YNGVQGGGATWRLPRKPRKHETHENYKKSFSWVSSFRAFRGYSEYRPEGRGSLRERLRDLEALPVRLARQQPIRVLVVHEALFAPVERERAADAVRDVREMRQRRREVPFHDVAGEQLRIAGADCVDEVLIVRRFDRGQPGRLDLLTRGHVRSRTFF